MLSTKLSRILLTLGLFVTFSSAGVATAMADEPVRPEYKRKKCEDRNYDRNALEDEERTSGDCSGTVPTPEPISILLFSAGLAGVGFVARRHFRRSE